MSYVEGSVLINDSFTSIARSIARSGEMFIISRLLGAERQKVYVHTTRTGVTIRVEGALITVVRRTNHSSVRSFLLEGNARYRLQQGQKIGFFPPEDGGSGFLQVSVRKPFIRHSLPLVG